MAQTDIGRLQALTAQLNRHRLEYYSLNAPTVSDEVYDRLFDELIQLDWELGVKMGNSLTQTVGWPAVEPFTRDEIHAQVRALGAHASSSVSGKTDYLICGENAGSKLDKARSLGITVLTPAQFFQMAGV